MRATPKTEQVGAGNTDPFDRKALSKASSEYTKSDATTTIRFPRNRVAQRRFASVRLKEIYHLALYRRRASFIVNGTTFVSAMAFTLSFEPAGNVFDQAEHQDRGKPRRVPWMGLSLNTLRRAIVSAELGYFDDEELLTVIAGVRTWRAEKGSKLHTAPQLGRDLQLTRIERDACSIRTIEAVDEPKAERQARLRAEKRDRDREYNRTNRNRKPRPVYLAQADIRRRFCEEHGITDRTLRRWIKAGKTDVRSATFHKRDILSASDFGHSVTPSKIHAVEGAARIDSDDRNVSAGVPSHGARKIEGKGDRRDGAAAFEEEAGGTLIALVPRHREAPPDEPPLPPLAPDIARIVALIERAHDLLAEIRDELRPQGLETMDGMLDALEGCVDLLWVVNEGDPAGAAEVARVCATSCAELMGLMNANDNRVADLTRMLAA